MSKSKGIDFRSIPSLSRTPPLYKGERMKRILIGIASGLLAGLKCLFVPGYSKRIF
jgi:hypothetical protein